MIMEMADKLEQEEREYEAYLERLEEESNNYQIVLRRQAIEKMKE